ncbi:MAG: hypothetical protein ACUVTD_07585 [Nitrososphaerales archaeon]
MRKFHQKTWRGLLSRAEFLAGTLQTANIGLEKIIANVVANPNIRYLILCGKEVDGYKAGDAGDSLFTYHTEISKNESKRKKKKEVKRKEKMKTNNRAYM